MTSITRRTVLGGMAVAAIASAVLAENLSAGQTVEEASEAKCTRLALELLAEFRRCQAQGRTKFGIFVEFSLGEKGDFIRYGRADNSHEILTVFLNTPKGDLL